jgi:hypothetical protein
MTRRPVLAPGLRPLRLSNGELVFGLSSEHRLRVPDSPSIRRALSILERGEALPDTAEIRRARVVLAPVLRDGDSLVRPGLAPGEVAAVALRHARTATARLDARGRARIRVEGDLGIDVEPLLAAVGLASAEVPGSRPTAVLLLSQGEVARERLDDLVRTGVPHVLVRALEAEIVLGPFVLPGTSSCVRCHDLHRRTQDPTYGALLASLASTSRHDGVAEPVPVAPAWMALGWAVNDLVRHAEGELPTTAGSVVRLHAGSTAYAAQSAPAHPGCSCRWSAGDDQLEPSVTMEV